ncbi:MULTISPECIES: hypothetical protein [unclassified Streptomyces]|uniref:DinB/UmuC family translesion DNA polymerase n=1 Tax=unclassified Streptomyces TaxID=2593676 RepID=UPI00381A548C
MPVSFVVHLDPRPVVPSEPAARLVADLMLERDRLDPVQHHRAVLGLADRIDQRLRGQCRIVGGLTLTVRYADRSSTTHTRVLPELTDHSPTLVAAALGLLTGLGLQRARVCAFVIRADDLLSADNACRQLSLAPRDARACSRSRSRSRSRR